MHGKGLPPKEREHYARTERSREKRGESDVS